MIGVILQERYRIELELGSGGMGVVYRAYDLVLNRPVAVKLLSRTGMGTAGRNRLLAEAQTAARLNHPNVVNIYDAGQALLPNEREPIPFLVMEFVQGESLRQRLAGNLEESLAIIRQVCAVLGHAHSAGVVHRDLKPENIIVTHNQQVKLMDFGLARAADAPQITEEGIVVGTLSYLAPEVVLGQPATPQSDLYALGVVMYELVTGRMPFPGENLMTIISQHLYAPPVPPSSYNPIISPALDELVLALLAKQPGERPASAGDVAQRLDQITAPRPEIPPPPASPLNRLARGRMIGRQREFQQAKNLWQQCLESNAQLLLISGEPGIGKTRFVRELMVLAELASGIALQGECYAEGGPPYAPIIQMVRQLVANPRLAWMPLPESILPDLVALAPDLQQRYPQVSPALAVDPQTGQQRFFDTIFSLVSIVSGRIPLILVLDDAHWSDSDSLFLMRYLARRSRTGRYKLLIVFTYREIELDEARTLHELLADFHRERLSNRLKLLRLDRDQTATMLTALFDQVVTGDFLDGIYRETEGNPFFIEEVCKALVEDGAVYHEGQQWQRREMSQIRIPQSIRLAIQGRIGKLAPKTQDVLRLAAIVGREFEFPILQQSLEISEDDLVDALEEGQRAQLIYEVRNRSQETFAFVHALVSTTLRDGMSGLRRHRLHRRIATVIERLRPDDFEALAHHYSESGDEELSRTYHLRAGDRALAAYANQDAEHHYRAVLELGTGAIMLAPLLDNLGEALARQSRYQEAVEVWRKVIELYRYQNDYDHLAQMYARMARVLAYSGDEITALAVCREGVVALSGREDSVGLAMLWHEMARSCYFNGLVEEAYQYGQSLLAMTDRLNAVEVRADALATLALLPKQSLEESQAMLRQSAALAEAHQLFAIATRAHNNLANNLEEIGALTEALDHYLRAATFCRQRGAVTEELFVVSQAVNISAWLGKLAEADNMIAQLHKLVSGVSGFTAGLFQLQVTEAIMLRYRGQSAEAIAQFQALLKNAESRNDRQDVTLINFQLAEMFLELGRFNEAEKVLLNSITGPASLSRRGIWSLCLLSAAYGRQKRLIEAEGYLADAHFAMPEPSAFDQIYLLLAEALLAQSKKEWEKAIIAFEKVVGIQQQIGVIWYQAQTLRLWARMYVAAGRLLPAGECLQRAWAIFHGLGLAYYTDLVEQSLRTLHLATE